MRRTFPLLLCTLAGVLVLLDFFLTPAAIARANEAVIEWTLVIVAASFLLGGVNVLVVNVQHVRRRAGGWGYNAVLVVCLVGMALLGILGDIGEGSVFDWLFQNVQIPMQSTMFSILAFYIASAAYRAFRMRTAQATVLLVTAIIVMVGNVPLGYALGGGWPKLSSWILATPSLAAQRGLILGAALGAVATAIRILVGIERSFLGVRE